MKDIASYKRSLRERLRRGALVLGAGLTLLYFSGAFTSSQPFWQDFVPPAERPPFNAMELLALPGIPFVTWGIVILSNLMTDWLLLKRAIPAIRQRFPKLDISGIPPRAEFAIEEIGAFIYEDHLFLISDETFYLEDLRRVERVFTLPGPGRWIQSLMLAVTRNDKTRSYLLVPYSTETFIKPSQLWVKSGANTERLLEWLHQKYPHIRIGCSKEREKDWLSGLPIWKRIWEMARRDWP